MKKIEIAIKLSDETLHYEKRLFDYEPQMDDYITIPHPHIAGLVIGGPVVMRIHRPIPDTRCMMLRVLLGESASSSQ